MDIENELAIYGSAEEDKFIARHKPDYEYEVTAKCYFTEGFDSCSLFLMEKITALQSERDEQWLLRREAESRGVNDRAVIAELTAELSAAQAKIESLTVKSEYEEHYAQCLSDSWIELKKAGIIQDGEKGVDQGISELAVKLSAYREQKPVGEVVGDPISIKAALNGLGYRNLEVGDKLYAQAAPVQQPVPNTPTVERFVDLRQLHGRRIGDVRLDDQLLSEFD